jgi:hypothetical protein
MSFVSDFFEFGSSSYLTDKLVARCAAAYLDRSLPCPEWVSARDPHIDQMRCELNRHGAWLSVMVCAIPEPSDQINNDWLAGVLDHARAPALHALLAHPVPMGAFRLKQAYQAMERHLTQSGVPVPSPPILAILDAQKGGLASLLLRHIPFHQFGWSDTFCYHRHTQAFSLVERRGSSNEDVLRCYFPHASIDMAMSFEVSPHEFLYSLSLRPQVAIDYALPEMPLEGFFV